MASSIIETSLDKKGLCEAVRWKIFTEYKTPKSELDHVAIGDFVYNINIFII